MGCEWGVGLMSLVGIGNVGNGIWGGKVKR